MLPVVHSSRDDADHPVPEQRGESPRRLSRRKMLTLTAGLVTGGGLAAGGGYAWAHGPGGPLSYEAKQLQALRDDPMGAGTILGISAIFTESPEFPRWFQWKYGGVWLRRWFYAADRPPAQLGDLFIAYAEHHGWTKDPGPSTPESWIGRHGGPAPTDDMILNIAPDLGPRETEPLNNSVNVRLWYL